MSVKNQTAIPNTFWHHATLCCQNRNLDAGVAVIVSLKNMWFIPAVSFEAQATWILVISHFHVKIFKVKIKRFQFISVWQKNLINFNTESIQVVTTNNK